MPRYPRPSGVIYVKTLFLDCAAHLMNDDRWTLLGMPQPGESHFYYYRPRVLTEMIKAAGFELCYVRIGQVIAVIARKPAGSSWPCRRVPRGPRAAP